MQNSNSSLSSLSLIEKLRYSVDLLQLHLKRRRKVDLTWLLRMFDEYDSYSRKFVGKPLNECRTLEIGFGARPLRLFFLMAKGVDVYGVDLDAPLLDVSPAALRRIAERNGLERAAKSLTRWFVVQRKEYAELARICDTYGGSEVPSFRNLASRARERLIVSDAAADGFWGQFEKPFQFVYSEDVFEHIPPAALDKILSQLAEHLDPAGIALIRPNIFSGITGGHQIEWYHNVINDSSLVRRSEPWDHLRKNLFPANTYLNRLLLRDYRSKFSQHFDILEEITTLPDFGRQYLSPSIAEELAAYTDEELFSNQVLFVLRKKQR